MIKNLALKGGGVKGIAYVGSLRELDKRGHYKTLERVSGTSAGALVALMVALRLSPDQIETLMKGLDFNAFKSGWNPIRIFTKYGLYSGDEILKFIHSCYEASSLKLDKKATFKDFTDAGGMDLIVFASNLNMHNITEFSNFATPGCIVAEAVRASMSIPIFFKSWKFSNGVPNDHIYVDGGVMFNYPLSFFDKPRFHKNQLTINTETIGLFLEPKKVYEQFEDSPLSSTPTHTLQHPRPLKMNYISPFKWGMWITQYLSHLFEALMNSQDVELFEEAHLMSRSIFIDDLGISATKFNLTDKEKDDLVESGRIGAINYFNFLKTFEQNLNQQVNS